MTYISACPLDIQGAGALVSIFAKYVPLASQNPNPIRAYFMVYLVANYRLHLSHFWALESISGLFCGQLKTPSWSLSGKVFS